MIVIHPIADSLLISHQKGCIEAKDTTDKLRIAIIGCGWAGEKHVLALKRLSARAEAAALVDTDIIFLEEKSKEWGISECYADYRDVLSREDIDAVSICLPHNLHVQVAIESARAGEPIGRN